MAIEDSETGLIAFPTMANDPPREFDENEQDGDEDDYEEKGTGELRARIRGKLCTVVYDKYGFTPQLLRKVLQFEQLSGASDVASTLRLIELCTDVISKLALSWDATDALGVLVPLTSEGMEAKLDLNSLTTVMVALQQEIMPGEEVGSASQKASSVAASATPSGRAKSTNRNSTRTSKRRNA